MHWVTNISPQFLEELEIYFARKFLAFYLFAEIFSNIFFKAYFIFFFFLIYDNLIINNFLIYDNLIISNLSKLISLSYYKL